MKTKFNGILTLLLAFIVQITFAQERVISGVVSDDIGPVADISVTVKGTTKGTVTDFDGKYSIKAKKGDTLVFSHVSYGAVEKVVGDSNTINVQMKETGETLKEVVVTAQGIKREKRALGYAVSTISTDEIEGKSEGDIGRLLKGKAAGVRITSTGGVSGSGTNIIIRGMSSISGDNQPLFIVDGVPFDSSTNAQGSFVTSSNQASRFGDIDPNNIESLTVLKGLSATALYGEEGKNGVVLITTKSGRHTKSKTEVTLSQSLFVNKIVLPDYQNSYGGGFFNDYGPFFSNWGAPFSAQSTVPNPYRAMMLNNFGILPSELFPGRTDLDSPTLEYRPYDSQKKYFRDGVISNSSVNISGNNSSEDGRRSTFNINYGYLDDKGFVPENSFRRNALSLGGSTELTNKFKIIGKFNYSKVSKKAPMMDASFGSDVFGTGISSIWNVLYMPRSIDLFGFPYQHPITGESLWYRNDNGRTNPLWATYNTKDDNKVNRFFGNAAVTYDFNDNSNLMYRFGYDFYTEDQLRGENRGANDGAFPLGYLRTTVIQNNINDHSLIYNYEKNIFENVGLTANVGLNLRRTTFKRQRITSTRQLANAFGLFRHSVFENREPGPGVNGTNDYAQEVNNNALYAELIFEINHWLYFNVSGRNDWSSVFEKSQRSIFSYGASVSMDLTKGISALNDSDKVDFLKLRLGYGQAPGFAGPYSTRPDLAIASELIDFNGGSIPGNFVPNFLPNPNLKPELSKEVEVGLEGKFFNNRVGFDLTLYKKLTEDQIISRPIPAETGYTRYADNFGSVSNKGIELGFNLVPLKKGDFSWTVSGAYNLNENIVEDTDGQVVQISGFSGSLGNYAIEGQPFGVIQGSVVQRDQNGVMLVDDNGDYVVDAETKIIGNPIPKWTMSVVNGFNYKNLSLTAQLEYQHGGDMFLKTVATLLGRGLTTETDFDRYQTFILPGNNVNTGLPNTTQIAATDAYFTNYGFGANEFAIFDATNLRLREVTLAYKLPKKLIDKLPFGSVSFNIQAYNLFVKTFNIPDGANFDPDINSLGVGNGSGFDFLTSWNSRRFGGGLKITF